MLIKTMQRFKRAPISAIAVLMFSVILSIVICALHASNEAELQHYEETYQAVPITVTVTHLAQTDFTKKPIQHWVFYLFTEEESVEFYDLYALEDPNDSIAVVEFIRKTEPIELSLAEYVKDVQVNMHRMISTVNDKKFKNPQLNGITSLFCDKQLLPEYGCAITWIDGYDESIFNGNEPVCIIPKGMAEQYDNGSGEAVLEFTGKVRNRVQIDGKYQTVVEEVSYQCTLKIVGTYTAGDEKSIYCPIPIIEQVYSAFEEKPSIWSLSATLADNNRLEEFREKMSLCFLEDAPGIEITPWGYFASYGISGFYNEYYPFALDIDDENLFDLAAILEDSIKFNRTVTVFVVILSVVAGFLVGFLMIRCRKREIMLMRTVGESNMRVYWGFILEQMTGIILGIAIGGAYYLWEPINNILLFALVYFLALSLALIIFMNKKLLTNIKEDE